MRPIECLSELAVAIHYANHAYVEDDSVGNDPNFTLVLERTKKATNEAFINLLKASMEEAESSSNPEDRKIVYMSIEAIYKRLDHMGKLPAFNFLREARKAWLFSTEKEKKLEETKTRVSALLDRIKGWKEESADKDVATRINVLSMLLENQQFRPLKPNQDLRAFIHEFQGWMRQNGFDLKDEQVLEILKGGHVLIEDDGEWYRKVEGREDKRARGSSHYNGRDLDEDGKKIQQYGIAGDLIHELLVGKVIVTDENGEKKTKTWFQLENTPWAAGIQSVVGHSLDFIQYKISGKNVGPHGLSVHTDSRPIVLKKATP